MIREDLYLGKCVYLFCENEAHYTCDLCEYEFCKEHMSGNNFCIECGYGT